jgi:hypothetical protein
MKFEMHPTAVVHFIVDFFVIVFFIALVVIPRGAPRTLAALSFGRSLE